MGQNASIIIGARDETAAAFRSVQGNLNQTSSIADSVRDGMATLATVTVAAIIASALAFDQLVKKAGDFQDMAEKTGDTAQNISSLAVAAATAGVSMDSVVSAANKLTQNLTGVDDESKAAGAAVAALGLNLADLKNQSPTERFVTISRALDGFADSADKAAVAQALMGKSGSEQLPFLKELAGETGRVNILTDEQIKLADDYADKQAKSRAELGLHATALATQMLPALNKVTDGLRDIAKDQEFAATASGLLKGAMSVAVVTFQTFAVVGSEVGFVLLSVGREIGAMAAQIAALSTLDLEGFNAISRAVKEDGVRARAELDRFQARVMGIGKATAPVFSQTTETPAAQDTRKKLNFAGAAKKDTTAAQEAKAQLAFDIDQIKKGGEAIINTFANSERILDAMRSAGLLDERDYYDAKLAMLHLNSTEQEATLQKEIARLQSEKLIGKDKLDNQRKIADAQAQLAKVRENADANVEVLKIKETSALNAIAQSYRDAEAAAQSYLDAIRLTQARELAGAGAGTQARERLSGRTQISDKFTQQSRDLEKSRRDAELSGTFGADAKNKYDDELARIKRFQIMALSEYDAFFAQRTAKEQGWSNGATEALNNYFTESRNIAGQVNNLFVTAFQGMEDALVQFVTTGKLDFASLANSIVADISRIIIKQQIMNAMSSFGIGGGGGSSGDAGIGVLGSLFGRANGGPVSAGQMYRVNERRPELLNVAGRQYLMMGSQSGSVDPNAGASGSNTVSVTVNQSFAPGITRTTTLQAAADASRQLQIAGRNL